MCIRDSTPSQQKALDQLCEEFPSVLTPTLGLAHLLEYKIRLTDSKMVRSHPYKFAPPKMAVLRENVQELLKQGVIEPVSYTHLDVYKRQILYNNTMYRPTSALILSKYNLFL